MDDERSDLARLVRATRERLAWEARGGVTGAPRGSLPRRSAAADRDAAAAALPTTEAASPAPSDERAAAPRTPPRAAPPATAPGARRSLTLIREELGDCQRCKLAGGRTQIVFGVGNPDAPVVFVGEGPGADEDRTGEPFVGKAGQLLTRMIAAMGLLREEVYICNVVKCRPPNNRAPEPDEVDACEPFLRQQLASIRPKIIVALGKSATQALLKTNASISGLRGRFVPYQGIPLMPTFHPAYLLRTPSAKREVWEDLQRVMAELDRLGVPRRPAPASGQ